MFWCPATAKIETDNTFHLKNQHNHRPEERNLDVPFLRAAIGERGIQPTYTSVSVRGLYNQEIIK